MRKKISNPILTILMLLSALVFIGSCSNNSGEGGNVADTRSFDTCFEEINYTMEVQTFKHFFPENEELTLREKVISVPKNEYFKVKICTTSFGDYLIETSALPEMTTQINYPADALGVPELLKWRSINTNGTLITYNEKNEAIDNSVAGQQLSQAQISKIGYFKALPLNNDSDFMMIMEELKKQLPMTTLPNGDFMITTMVDNKKVETVISKEYQREVSQSIYDSANEIQSLTTWKYDIVNEKTVLKTESFNSFMKSLDSEKTLCLSKIHNYSFN